MIFSMTGFGAVQETRGDFNISVEVKSVNHRHLEMKVRLAPDWYDLEIPIREFIKNKFKRGFFDVSVRREILPDRVMGEYLVNRKLVRTYYKTAEKIAQDLKLRPPSVDHILRNTDFIQYQPKKLSPATKWKLLLPTLQKACKKLEFMRQKEGKNLLKELKRLLLKMTQLHENIEKRAPHIKEQIAERVRKRIGDLKLEGFDQNRIEQEIVFLAERADITEEVVRLQSHLKQFDQILGSSDSVGKQLDFLIQEMNREVNTIASKASNLNINQTAVEFKTELEKLREQIQNIE
ncbi:MAG TPA: YicC/YloC family endoribonuclease [Bdellovibrionota bacterium]|nr:YicC/YloC family endoribonuclease [Bdellovibrionota bacterium]